MSSGIIWADQKTMAAPGVSLFGYDTGVIKGSLQFLLKSDLSPAAKGFSQPFHPDMKFILVIGIIFVVLPRFAWNVKKPPWPKTNGPTNTRSVPTCTDVCRQPSVDYDWEEESVLLDTKVKVPASQPLLSNDQLNSLADGLQSLSAAQQLRLYGSGSVGGEMS